MRALLIFSAAALLGTGLALSAVPTGTFDARELARRQALLAGAGKPAAMAVALNDIAQECRFQGRYLEAEKYYREAIHEWEASLGPEHPDVAKGLTNLAAFYHERQRETGAEDLYRRASTILEHALGANDVRTLLTRNELADVLRGERRFNESDRLGKSTLSTLESRLTASDPRLIRALNNRARLLTDMNRGAEAEVVLRRARRTR